MTIHDTNNANIASPMDIEAVYKLLMNARIRPAGNGSVTLYAKIPLEDAMQLESLQSKLEDMEPDDQE
ncbi:MAG: hypothetical protein COB90_07975 [Hyphomicrobiales bacterium]|nr:MAG: hypothetical protein COB90_07975 [Hyphomicrobiales bacterium]